MMLGSAESELP